MKKKKKIEYSAEEKRAILIYERIIKGIFIAGIVLFFVHWACLLGAIGLILWSAYFYEKGLMEWVCDEYELDGYPKQGLYRMFQSWKTLAVLVVIAAIALIIYYQ